MKQLDSVRVRPINSSADERLSTQKYATNLIGGISDVKVTISQIEPSDLQNSQLNLAPGADLIVEWLPISDSRNFVRKVYTKEEVSKVKAENNDGITFSDVIFGKMIEQQSESYRQIKGIKTKEEVYAIVQNPYLDNPPELRSFGSDPYYLNNGAKIDIIWMIGDKFTSPQTPEFRKNFYESFGFDLKKPFLISGGPEIIQSSTFSQVIGSESNKIPKGTWLGGLYWSTPSGNEFDPSVNGGAFSKGTSSNSYYLDNGIWKNPDNGRLERYPIEKINKYIIISSPKVNENGTKKEEIFSVKDVNIADFSYIKPAPTSTRENGSNFYNFYVTGTGTASGGTPSSGTPSGGTPSTSTGDNTLKRLAEIPKINKDIDIIGAIIETWKRKVPNYGKLAISKPSYFPTLELEYISPINPGTGSTNDSGDNKSDPNSVKFPLVVQLPTPLDIKSKKDMPSFKVYVNKIPEIDPDNIFTDEIEQFLQGDDEYVETEFAGEGERIRTIEEDIQLEKEMKQAAVQLEQQSPGSSSPIIPDGSGSSGSPTADTPGYASGAVPVGFNGVPYFCQGDERWGEIPYNTKDKSGKVTAVCDDKWGPGGKANVKTSGCGMTSMAMLICFWAKKGYATSYTDPAQLSELFMRNGGRQCGQGSNFDHDMPKVLREKFGIECSGTGNINQEGAIKALKKGYPVIICGARFSGCLSDSGGKLGDVGAGKTGGHYVLMTGIDDQGRVRINDPGYAANRTARAFPDTNLGSYCTVKSFTIAYPTKLGKP